MYFLCSILAIFLSQSSLTLCCWKSTHCSEFCLPSVTASPSAITTSITIGFNTFDTPANFGILDSKPRAFIYGIPPYIEPTVNPACFNKSAHPLAVLNIDLIGFSSS